MYPFSIHSWILSRGMDNSSATSCSVQSCVRTYSFTLRYKMSSLQELQYSSLYPFGRIRPHFLHLGLSFSSGNSFFAIFYLSIQSINSEKISVLDSNRLIEVGIRIITCRQKSRGPVIETEFPDVRRNKRKWKRAAVQFVFGKHVFKKCVSVRGFRDSSTPSRSIIPALSFASSAYSAGTSIGSDSSLSIVR